MVPLTKELYEFYSYLKTNAPYMLGYPGNLNNDFSELNIFFEFIINNVGDPSCTDEAYRMHSKEYELKILEFFRNIYNLNPNSWGYLTNGGTEGNTMGLLLGRSKYPNSKLYSTNGHYSIKKNAYILNIPYVEIKTSKNGEISYENLYSYLSNNKEPPIINLTIGTTFDGAIDNVYRVLAILEETSHKDFYIHCDAALFGGFIPFLKIDHEMSFENVDSISISAHKFFGIPFPSGIFLSKEKPHCGFVENIGYIDSDDTTITGSRNGQLALFLWALIESKGVDGFRKEALSCIENAKYLEKSLAEINLNPKLNDYSNIVTFDTPPKEIISKWQLATKKDRSHVVVMQHVKKEMIDLLTSDIVSAQNLKNQISN
ncbi:MAG: histidine decarboxylase [Candidatus Paceibacterota bacterium]